MLDVRGQAAGILRYLGSFWPGWMIIFGLLLVIYGLVAWGYPDSVTEILRRARNPSISEETSSRLYTSDHTKLVATATGIVGLVVIVAGAITTVLYYVQ